MRSFLHIFLLFTFANLATRADKQQHKKESKNYEEESNAIENELVEADASLKDGQEEIVDLSHGFGTDIDWVGWPNAISIALDLNKPIFILIHKTWCGACTALKKSFNTSNKRVELVELSKKFVMVNLEDDDEPEDEIYAPDGRYIPRLFILNKKGEPLAVDNRKNYPNNRQYFPQVPDVIKAMKQGLEILERDGERKPSNDPEKMPKKSKEEDPKAGGCPHAAGKAKKAAEEAAKVAKEQEKKDKGKGEKKAKEGKNKEEGKAGKKKESGKEKAGGKEEKPKKKEEPKEEL